MTNNFEKSTTVTRQKRRLTICILRVWSHRFHGERWRTEKKESIERGIGFFPTRGSVWSGRSMVGGVIKDLGPYKLEKEQKRKERRKKIQRIVLSLSLSRLYSLSKRMTERRSEGKRERRRKREKQQSSRRVRRQPVTNLTLNQLTCAWLHGRTNARRCIRALARALDPSYSLVICITLYMRCSFLSNILAGGTCVCGPA